MMNYMRLILIAVLAANLIACEEENSGWCSDQDKEQLAACREDATACKGPDDCANEPGRNVCDVDGSKTCVQCTPASSSACTLNTPTCGANLQCRGCEAHSECASDACMLGGACLDEDDVIYVEGGGTGAAPCLKAAPCGILALAVSQVLLVGDRRNIRIKGTVVGETSIMTKVLTIFGDKDSALKGITGGSGPPILDVGMNSTVQLHGFTLQDSRSSGVKISSTSRMTMTRTKIVGSAREGLDIDGNVTVLQSEIAGSKDPTRRAVAVTNGGELTMDRSIVANNEGGGILVADGGEFSIANSFIVGNKGQGGFFSANPRNGSKLEFNTIVDNVSGMGATAAGGVVCDNASASARNNIIFRNIGGPAGAVQKLGQCSFTGSFDSPGTSATDDTLKFKSEMAGSKDYHLTAASPSSVKDAGGLTCPAMDYDGDPRPTPGGACDLGADEIK